MLLDPFDGDVASLALEAPHRSRIGADGRRHQRLRQTFAPVLRER
jgi:hypothetical protein